jgi:threonine dehydratase
MASRVGLPFRIRAPLQWVSHRDTAAPHNAVTKKAAAAVADSIGEETWSPLQAPNYLRLILTSKVYEAAPVTPLQHAPSLSTSFGNNVYLKREDLTPGFSFKLRGVFNKLSLLSPEERAKGVVTYSTGNHAYATASAAKMLGIKAKIVMPSALPLDRCGAMRLLGARLRMLVASESRQ